MSHSIQQAYLRWLPSFSVKPRQRQVGIHMCLTAGTETVFGPIDGTFPCQAEKVTLWTSQSEEESCVFCQQKDALAGEMLSYHPKELAPKKASAACEIDTEKLIRELEGPVKRKKNRRKKKTRPEVSAPDPDAEIVTPNSTGSEPIDAANSGESIDIAEEPMMVSSASSDSPIRSDFAMQRFTPTPARLDDRVLDFTRLAQETHYEISEDGCLSDLRDVVQELAGVVRSLATSVRSTSEAARLNSDSVQGLVSAIREQSETLRIMQAVQEQTSRDIQTLAEQAAEDRKVSRLFAEQASEDRRALMTLAKQAEEDRKLLRQLVTTLK